MSKYLEIKQKYPSVKIVCVTKEHAWNECTFLYNEGARQFGENKVQEAIPKMEEAPKDIDWHFIGNLQKNKVNKVVGQFSLIHSVDTFELAEKISQTAIHPQPILLQINIMHKHGFTPNDLREKFPRLQALKGIDIQGLMTMAPDTDDFTLIRNVFSEAYKLKEELRLKELSMGMSHDYPIAIEEGATMIRVGTLLFT